MLEDAIEDKISCVVITHHMPSYKLIDEKYYDDNYNMWFASHLDNIIIQHKQKIKGWIYGHTHSANRCVLHDVKMYCNPLGYKGENKKPNYNESDVL